MSEGEFERKIQEEESNIFADYVMIPAVLKVVAEVKKELYDYWRRGLIHEGLVKWFGTHKGIHKGTHKQSLKVVSKGKAEKYCRYEYCGIKIPHTHGICGCVYCKECGQVIRSCVTPLELKLVSQGPCKACGKDVWVVKGNGVNFTSPVKVDVAFNRRCHNLGGKECPGANASDCIARINGLACPTYSKKELMEIKSKC